MTLILQLFINKKYLSVKKLPPQFQITSKKTKQNKTPLKAQLNTN